MTEVEAELRFNQPALGGCREQKIHRMLRDPDGRVMFLPTWWGHLMVFAAQVLGRHHGVVKQINWDPVIEGQTQEFERFYGQGCFTRHEAFLPGDCIHVRAVLPATLSVEDFSELLQVAGQYRGISPYRKDKRYRFGTFEVLSVQRRVRRGKK